MLPTTIIFLLAWCWELFLPSEKMGTEDDEREKRAVDREVALLGRTASCIISYIHILPPCKAPGRETVTWPVLYYFVNDADHDFARRHHQSMIFDFLWFLDFSCWFARIHHKLLLHHSLQGRKMECFFWNPAVQFPAPIIFVSKWGWGWNVTGSRVRIVFCHLPLYSSCNCNPLPTSNFTTTLFDLATGPSWIKGCYLRGMSFKKQKIILMLPQSADSACIVVVLYLAERDFERRIEKVL